MIFDGELVTSLVLEWQRTKEDALLERILLECRNLIEAIASSYGSLDREDLIQEAYIKVQGALPHYDPRVATLHNYLTTVIRNICITYVTKEDKQPTDELQVNLLGDKLYSKIDETDILAELIIRNRQRFISIPVQVIDDMTEYFYYELRDDGMLRKTITKAASMFGCSRSIASTVYHSTIVYLRMRYIDCGECNNDVIAEFSLLPELEELIGSDNYQQVLLVFSGMSIKVP